MTSRATVLSAPVVGSRTLAVESCKWLGFVAMVIDHLSLYVGLGPASVAQHVGALAFPLFALSLVFSVFDFPQQRLQVLISRLLLWGFVAQVAGTMVERSFPPLNVLFTFAFGVWIYYELLNSAAGSKRIILLLFLCFASLFVEFSIVGVGLIVASLLALKSHQMQGPVLALSCVSVFFLALLSIFNAGSFLALVAPVLFVGLSLLPDLRRVPRLFYYLYAGQFPVFFLLKKVLL